MTSVSSDCSNDAADSSSDDWQPSTTSYPRGIMAFPSTDWQGVVFSHPYFRPGELRLKAIWASRAVSDKILEAFDTDNPDAVDKIDFALAVFAKASEM